MTPGAIEGVRPENFQLPCRVALLFPKKTLLAGESPALYIILLLPPVHQYTRFKMISSTFRSLRDTASNLLTPLATTLLPLSPGQLSLSDFILSGCVGFGHPVLPFDLLSCFFTSCLDF
jgi:hypothetical protein